MPRQHRGTAVTKVREERKTRVDAGPQFIQRGIAMPGRNANPHARQLLRYPLPGIALWRKSYDSHPTISGIQHSRHRLRIRESRVALWVRPDVSVGWIQKRSFNMKAQQHFRNGFVGIFD